MGEGRGHDVVRQSSPIVLAAAAVTLGVILHVSNGSVAPGLMGRAMAGMTVVALLCAWAVLMPGRSITRRADRWLAAMLFLQLALFFVSGRRFPSIRTIVRGSRRSASAFRSWPSRPPLRCEIGLASADG